MCLVTFFGRQAATLPGCYANGGYYLLGAYLEDLGGVATPQYCIQICSYKGFRYAGLEAGSKCYCGNTFAYTPTPLASTKCERPCTGDKTLKCGGDRAVYVYDTVSEIQLMNMRWVPFVVTAEQLPSDR